MVNESLRLTKMFAEQFKLYQMLLKTRANIDLEIECTKNPIPLLEDNVYYAIEELHEMGRELPYFKFWKTYLVVDFNGTSKAKEEFIDVLHFLINIAIVLLVQPTMYTIPQIDPVIAPLKERCLLIKTKSLEINKKLIGICALKRSDLLTNQDSIQMYHEASYSIINDCLAIAAALQMTNTQIFQMYMSKNGINHDRQKSGY